MANRFFKLQEAEQLLPVLEALLRSAIGHKKEVEKLEGEFAALSQYVILRGGVLVDRDKYAGLKIDKENAIQELRDALAQVEASGCLIKDLDVGLIDFPCLVDQREIYLCWKLGEQHIGFWHNTDEGFRGRKPIDKAWLDGRGGEDFRPN